MTDSWRGCCASPEICASTRFAVAGPEDLLAEDNEWAMPDTAPDPLYPLLGIFLAFFFIYNIVDAGRRAIYYNFAINGVQGIEMPSMNLSVPSF